MCFQVAFGVGHLPTALGLCLLIGWRAYHLPLLGINIEESTDSTYQPLLRTASRKTTELGEHLSKSTNKTLTDAQVSLPDFHISHYREQVNTHFHHVININNLLETVLYPLESG